MTPGIRGMSALKQLGLRLSGRSGGIRMCRRWRVSLCA